MEEDLYLYAPSAHALVGTGLLPHGASTRQGVDGFARPVQLFEAVASPEEAEVVGRERLQRPVVPAQRLGPFLLPLEVPADGAMEDRGAPRRELGAAQEI